MLDTANNSTSRKSPFPHLSACLYKCCAFLFLVSLAAGNAHAYRATAEAMKTYIYESSFRYETLAELIENYETASRQNFDSCMAARGSGYGECWKHTISSQEPYSWGYTTNGETRQWNLSLTRHYDYKHIHGHDIGTEPHGGRRAIVAWSCPAGWTLTSEGSSDHNSVWCEKTIAESCDAGNPIDLLSGIKHEHAIDYQSADGRLRVERFYLDQYTGWVLDMGHRLLYLEDGESIATTGLFNSSGPTSCISPVTFNWTKYSATYGNPYDVVSYSRNRCLGLLNREAVPVIYLWVKGKQRRFVESSGIFILEGDIRSSIKIEPSNGLIVPGATWKFFSDDGSVSYFDVAGLILKTIFEDGSHIDYQYLNGQLVEKSDHAGRTIAYQYNIEGRLNSVTVPSGESIQYSYVSEDVEDPDNYWSLQSVHWADGSSMSYAYNESAYGGAGSLFLTGKFDAYGNRTGTYTYASNKAKTTEGYGGIEKRDVTYRSSTSVKFKDAIGTERTLYFNKLLGDGRRLPTQENQPGGSGCAAANNTTLYDTDGRVKEKRDFNGNKVQFAYDIARNLETVRVTGIPKTSYGTFTTNGATLPAGAAKTSTQWHTTLRKPVKKAEPKLITTFVYNGDADPFTGQTAQCAPNSLPMLCHLVQQATTDTNGAQGFSAIIDSTITSREWLYTYNSQGQLLTLARSATATPEQTRAYYNDTTANWLPGDLSSVTNALGQTIQFTQYDRNGRLLKMTDANGVETLFTYDARGRLTSQSIAGATTTHTYDLNGNRATSVLPNGVSVSYEYGPAKRLTAIINSAGDKITYEYDAESNLRFERVLNNSGTITYTKEHVYDALSRVQNTLNSSAQGSTFLYDAEGNLTGEVDANQHATQNAFDALGRVTKSIDPLNGQTHYTYNAQGHVTSVEDPEGLITHYTYNAFGDLIEQISPDTGTTTFTYDSAGNRTSATDSRGVVTNYTYDALNRLTTVSYPASPNENVIYTYDDTTNGNYGIGRLTGMSNASGTTSYIYNALGLVVQKQSTVHGVNSAILYNYDLAGNITSITYPSGRVVNYQRNTLGQVTTITTQSPGQTTEQTLLSNIGYLPFGPANNYVYGNGLSHTMTYDLDYRLTHIEVDGINPILERTYSYDPVNNISGVTNGVDTGKSQTFQYDALDRLTQANGFYGLLTYTYDGVGNRLTSALDDGTDQNQETYSYATQSHRLLGVDSTVNGTPDQTRQFTYDAAGNPQQHHSESGDLQDTTYNAANRLSTVAINGSPAATYSYNALGQRVSKVLANGTTEHYHYNETGQLIAVTDSTGATFREHIYFDSQKIALVEVTGQIYYIHNDHLATPQVATDTNQQVVWMADYQPFGKATETINTVKLYSRFPGQYEDEETGLYYNYFRDYDPSLGRYLQSDPIGLDGGINTYGYVHQNPIRFIDPLGLQTTVDAWCGKNPGACASILGRGTSRAGAAARAATSAGGGSCDDNDCEPLYSEISKLVSELKKRFADLVRNDGNLPQSGPMSIDGHLQQYWGKQRRLRRFLLTAESKGCNNYQPDAWSWATRDAPGPQYSGGLPE